MSLSGFMKQINKANQVSLGQIDKSSNVYINKTFMTNFDKTNQDA